VPHHIETAPSARAKCRACKKSIAKGELRLGVAVPNAFGDGEALHWFHLLCGAERRSAELLEALVADPSKVGLEERSRLEGLAQIGVAHPRWTRPAGAESSTTGRAKCRHCKEPILASTIRIKLEFVEDGMINPSGFLHPSCALPYLGPIDFIFDRLVRCSELSAEEVEELRSGLSAGVSSAGNSEAPAPGPETET
jgi:Poly(ADP-ribose) polymerase and DNA-Ligase Zn-finger region